MDAALPPHAPAGPTGRRVPNSSHLASKFATHEIVSVNRAMWLNCLRHCEGTPTAMGAKVRNGSIPAVGAEVTQSPLCLDSGHPPRALSRLTDSPEYGDRLAPQPVKITVTGY